MNGELLAGDGVLVLEARVADIGAAHVEELGQAADDIGGGAAFLLQEEVEMLALAAGFVEGDFLDEEITGAELDPAAGAGGVGGEVGEAGGEGGSGHGEGFRFN